MSAVQHDSEELLRQVAGFIIGAINTESESERFAQISDCFNMLEEHGYIH